LMTGPEAYFDETNLGDYATFGVRYLLLPDGRAPPVPAKLVRKSGPYVLWSVQTSGLIQVVDTQSSIAANASNIGVETESFLRSALPGEGVYPTIAFDGKSSAAPTLAVGSRNNGSPGTVLSFHNDLVQGEASATVFASRTAVVLLKASFDPGWTVTVDGQSAATEMIAPALVGVTVSPGNHVVVFRYRGFSSYPLLFIVGFLVMTCMGVGWNRWRRLLVQIFHLSKSRKVSS
jgi:hypothetical protein